MINDLTTSDSGSYQLKVNGLYYGKEDGFVFGQRTTVSVKDLNQRPTVTNPPLTEGQQATLTCTAPGLCSGSPPKITWMWRGKEENESMIGNLTALRTENLTAITQRHSSTLTFNPSAEHHNSNITCKVSFTGDITTEETLILKVNYKRKPHITGNTTVKEGDTLNLTCSIDSFPRSLVVWTKHSPSGFHLHNDTGSATLVVSNVTAEDSGRYFCTAIHLGSMVSVSADVKVTWFSEILEGSGCVLQSKLLTCVCIAKGFPLPTITWPLLKNHSKYSVINTVSNHTVNTTVTMSLKQHQNISVECFSSHENGEAQKNLTVQQDVVEKEDIQSKRISKSVFRLEVIVAFLIGVLLSATICCVAQKCKRKPMKIPANVHETLKMVPQDGPMIDDGQAVQNDKSHDQEEAENGAVAAERCLSDVSNGPKDVQYASINFSILRRRREREEVKERESTLTEYSEIQTEAKEQRKNDSKEASETMAGKKEDLMTEHCAEIKHCVSEKQGEVEAVYSTVKDILDE